MHLIQSPACTKAKIRSTGSVVNRLNTKAIGTLTMQMNTLSKKKVIIVLPPDRNVK